MESSNSRNSFADLLVRKEAGILRNNIKQLITAFPPEEKYRLSDQIIRASRSIGSNISKDYGRFTFKDQLHFCVQAQGSLSETHNHLIDVLSCSYIDDGVFQENLLQVKKVEQLLNGDITYVKQKTNNSKRINV